LAALVEEIEKAREVVEALVEGTLAVLLGLTG